MTRTSSASLDELKEIFHAACELQPNERSAFLDEHCGADTPARQEVEALLAAHQNADGFIADPPAQLAAEAFAEAEVPSWSGRTIGHYKLLERIGAGGMGDVYLAERADQQFQMRVAIKLIKRGMDTDSVLRRFQHERQILASLEHPNIARLLDGGTTEDGLPYFVMEYIKGDRIDQYANARRLSIQDRLELFRQVCGAVSYAHQRLVVHRDLKPSNILVTPAGVPKLLDFGIAKIIESNELAAATLVTITAPLMTPEYASPEQIEGTPTTTLSDVYSLGAVLYELLSGRPPHHLKTRTPQQIAHAITRGDIAKPSTVVTRPEDATRLRGDLDKIVLMALRKEASRRYQSVEQFSEDIRRHLVGRPVIARPDTLSYRAAKFAQRNKLGISAAALLLLSLLGGIIATTWQARRATMQEQRARAEQARAERRFNEVRKLANSVLFDYHDAINALPGATKVRERLVKDALTYLDSLAGEAHGDADLQRELGAAYERVGDVRGGIWSGNLGDTAGAMDSYIKALRIRETLVAMNSSDAQARGDLASSHKKLGTLLLQNDEADSGLAHLQKAFTLSLDLAREQPANDDLQLELARIRNRLGDAMTDRGEPVVALEQHQAALTICEKLVASHPRNQRYRRALLLTHGFISDALRSQNDEAGAIAARSKALALGEELLAEDPVNAEYRRLLVLSHQNAGDYREKSDKRGALEHFRRALTLNEELFAADPANALVRKDLAHSHRRVADLLAEMEDNSQALLHFRKSLETYEGVVADAPADFTSRFLVVTCRAGVARMQARLGEVESAMEECSKAIALLQEITGDKPGHLGRGQAHEYLGYAHVALATSPKASPNEKRERMSAARDMFRQTQSILDELRRQTGDLGANESWAKEIAGEIAKCDAALAHAQH